MDFDEELFMWFTEFRCGLTSASDGKGAGQPKGVVMPEDVNKIHA